MNCKSFRMEMEETLIGQRLSSREARAHAEACAGCRRFKSDNMSVRRLIESLDRVPAPSDFDFRVRARLASVAPKAKTKSNFFYAHKFIPGAAGIALAATFALVAALAIFFQHDPSTQWSAARYQPAIERTVPRANSSHVEQSLPLPSAQAPVAAPGNEAFEVKVTNGRRIEVAANRNKSRAKFSRTIASKFVENASSVADSGLKPISADSSITAAKVIIINPGSAGQVLQVQTATRPARITLENERGQKRNVSLNPVTFGAQEIIKQNDASPLPAARGVW